MDDEFDEYLGKYNKEMNNNNINPNADRSFLDKKDRPTDSMVINLFITDDDIANSLDLSDYSISELGNPDLIKTVEGTEWVLSKLVWYRDEGRIITFDIVQLSSNIDDIRNAKNSLISPVIDVDHEEVKPLGYHERLKIAEDNEDFDEAVRLRDWLTDFKDLFNTSFPLMRKAIDKADFDTYNKYMRKLNNHTDKLNG